MIAPLNHRACVMKSIVRVAADLTCEWVAALTIAALRSLQSSTAGVVVDLMLGALASHSHG